MRLRLLITVNLRVNVLAALALLFCLSNASIDAQTASAASDETIVLDGTAPAKEFPHFWENTFGSGRAILTLRDSYRRDLRAVRSITNLQRVRAHAIFHDENGVYDEDSSGKPVYNFSYVDQIYDGLLESGVQPFVELSFMPRKLAASLTPHAFWYKPFPSPPKDPAKWVALIAAFTRHLEDRYGKAEVEDWYFEVWNEPNIDFWTGNPQQSTYFELYDETARAVKTVDPEIRIGGPATAQAAWVDQFIAHCTKNHVPFDFVSTHVYGNEDSRDVFGKKLPITRRDMVARSAQKVFDQVKASAAPNTPIIWSEYSATYMNQQEVTDSAFMGPWLANNIRECDGLANIMSYWDLSDVFEEQGVVKTPFYGGYGLVAERGIPKASFRVFELLHRLGDQRLASPSENALITRRPDGSFVLALWNYAEPGAQASPKTFHLDIRNSALKSFSMQKVAPGSGSSLEAWKEMGGPVSPTQGQISQLIKASELAPAERHSVSTTVTLAPQSLAILEFDR